MKIAFIGTGNMGGACAQAVRQALPQAELLLANRTPEKAKALAGQLGGTVTDNRTAAETADFLFLGVKPQMLETLAGEADFGQHGGGGDGRAAECAVRREAAGHPDDAEPADDGEPGHDALVCKRCRHGG